MVYWDGESAPASRTGSGVLLLLGYELELIRHPAERRQRTGLHLVHQTTAMHLHSRLGDADVTGNLLAEATARDLDHDLAFPGAQRAEARLELGQCLLALPTRTIASKADLNGVEEVLIAERLGQELDGAALHRLHRHRDLAVPGGEEDARPLRVRRRQLALKIETALVRQSDVEDQAGRANRRTRFEKLGDGRKQPRIHVERSQQASDRGAQIRVVVDNQN